MRMAIVETLDIEALVTWALRDQGLGWGGRDSLVRDDYSDLGTVIDAGSTGSHPTISLLSDDDALVVKQGIDALPTEMRAVVILYGRAGLRPEGADEEIGEPEQLMDKRGRPRWRYDNPANKRGPKEPLLDVLGWTQKREAIRFARAQWTLWREALAALVGPLNAAMVTHRATGPAAPEHPWDMPRPAVHGLAGFAPSTEPQPWLRMGHAPELRHGRAIEDVRVSANAPVAAQASDWSAPTQPPRRRRAAPQAAG